MLKEKPRSWQLIDISYITLGITAGLSIFVIYLLFGKTQEVLKERLRQRLISIASTASLLFSPEDLEQIQSEDDLNKLEMKETIEKLRAIREKNENLKFIYILRPTDNPEEFTFIADAESLASLEEIDENGNLVIDADEQPPLPGDEYDASEVPQLIQAVNHATADLELNSDKWGTFLSGYAPIIDAEGKTVAVIGIDVQVEDFSQLVSALLLPLLLIGIFLLGLLSFQTVVLVRVWRSRVEIVKELDRQKDELISIVSHQLATPITSLKWYVEMLLAGDLGPVSAEQSEHLKSMRSITSDLSDLVGMILDVSRIQLGKMKLEKQELNLSEFFKEILGVITPRANEKGQNFVVSLPKELPIAKLDKRHTRMTIENLLSNAVKYTPEKGTVKFTVALTKDFINCIVEDTGCGIPKADQEKIFGKLFRASNVRNSVDGNGFGLYVAKGAVESQGGKIWFESEEGKGTRFYVNLPLQ